MYQLSSLQSLILRLLVACHNKSNVLGKSFDKQGIFFQRKRDQRDQRICDEINKLIIEVYQDYLFRAFVCHNRNTIIKLFCNDQSFFSFFDLRNKNMVYLGENMDLEENMQIGFFFSVFFCFFDGLRYLPGISRTGMA